MCTSSLLGLREVKRGKGTGNVEACKIKAEWGEGIKTEKKGILVMLKPFFSVFFPLTDACHFRLLVKRRRRNINKVPGVAVFEGIRA